MALKFIIEVEAVVPRTPRPNRVRGKSNSTATLTATAEHLEYPLTLSTLRSRPLTPVTSLRPGGSQNWQGAAR